VSLCFNDTTGRSECQALFEKIAYPPLVPKSIESMGDWLSTFQWDWWATFTFRFEVPDAIKAKLYFARFQKQLVKKIHHGFYYFLAVERFKSGLSTHLHCLLSNIDDVAYVTVGQAWFKRYGYAKIEKYDPGLGAAHYLTKYVTKEICDWDVSLRRH